MTTGRSGGLLKLKLRGVILIIKFNFVKKIFLHEFKLEVEHPSLVRFTIMVDGSKNGSILVFIHLRNLAI